MLSITAVNARDKMPAEYIPLTVNVESAIRSHKPDIAENYFTDSGYKMFELMLNRFKLIEMSGKRKCYFCDSEKKILRCSYPVKITFDNDSIVDKSLILRINVSNRKIESLTFALPQEVEANIFDKNCPWKENTRNVLMQFLEDFHTALVFSNIDYFERIISDQSIIKIDPIFSQDYINNSIVSMRNNEILSDDNSLSKQNNSKVKFLNYLKTWLNEYIVNVLWEESTIGSVNTNGILPRDAAFAIQMPYFSQCEKRDNAYRGCITLFLNMARKDPQVEVILCQSEDNAISYGEFLKKFKVI